MSTTSQSLHDKNIADNVESSLCEEITQYTASVLMEKHEIIKNDNVCINKDELINSFYQLHQNNILMKVQLKEYREIVEFLESKMNSDNEANKKKQKIYTIQY